MWQLHAADTHQWHLVPVFPSHPPLCSPPKSVWVFILLLLSFSSVGSNLRYPYFTVPINEELEKWKLSDGALQEGKNIVTSLPGVCKISCSDSQMDKQIVAPWRDCSTYLCLFLLPSPPMCLLQEGNIQSPVLKSTPGHIGSTNFHSCSHISSSSSPRCLNISIIYCHSEALLCYTYTVFSTNSKIWFITIVSNNCVSESVNCSWLPLLMVSRLAGH